MTEIEVANIDTFLLQLSSASPVPGGGSVAALQVALGASLVAMVANLTIGRRRYAVVEMEARDVLSRAETLRDRARALIDEDSAAYAAVAAAMDLPRGTDAEKEERAELIQQALKAAVAPPLRTMETAAAVTELAAQLVAFGNQSAVSDVGAAVLAAEAGFRAGKLNVDINLRAIQDQIWIEEVLRTLDGLPDPIDLTRQVMERVDLAIRGDEV